MDYPLSKNQFVKLYFNYFNWNFQDEVVLLENPELNHAHPLTLIRTLGKLIVEYSPNGFSPMNQNLSSEFSNQEVVNLLLNQTTHYEEIQSFIMYANGLMELPPIEGLRIETLSRTNKLEFGRLKSQCSQEDIISASVGLEDDDIMGIFHGKDLLAVGSLWYLGHDLADIHLLTHPKFRSIGLGKLLIALLVNRAIRLNRVAIVRGDRLNQATNKMVLDLGLIEAISIFEIHRS